MSTPVAFVLYIGVVILFALIGVIIINRSLKQEEKKSAARFQRFCGNN